MTQSTASLRPPPVHLNRYHHFTQVMRDPAVRCDVSRYTSKFDHSIQSLLVLRPTNGRAGDLFFFFHGMDGDCGDGLVMRELVATLGGTVIALGGRGPAWVADGFLVDAGQIIRREARGRENVYLVGISMGGTQALTLAAGLAGTLGARLAGVIAFIPGADLVDIATRSVNARVRDTVTASVDGDLGKLRERSPLNLVDKYPADLPFVIAYNVADTILPVASTVTFVSRLADRGVPVVAYRIPGDHSFVTDQLDERIDYASVIADLGKTMVAPRPVPTRSASSRAA